MAEIEQADSAQGNAHGKDEFSLLSEAHFRARSADVDDAPVCMFPERAVKPELCFRIPRKHFDGEPRTFFDAF